MVLHQVQGVRDGLIRDRLRCAWCCNRRTFPSPSGFVPSLPPPSGCCHWSCLEELLMVTGEQEADVCGYMGTSRFEGSQDKERAGQAERRKTGLQVKKAMEGPKDHCAGPGAASDSATVTFQDFRVCVCVSSYFFFSAPFFSSFPSELFGSLTMRVLFCCACLAEVNVDGKRNV